MKTEQVMAHFKIDKLFDRDPTLSPQADAGLDINSALHNIAGRIYRLGVWFSI